MGVKSKIINGTYLNLIHN